MNLAKNTIGMMLPLLLMLCACEEQHIKPSTSKDYFPLNEDREWSYQRWLSYGLNDSTIWDTLKLRVKGEVSIDEKLYRQIIDQDGNVDKVVRVEGSQYFARNHEWYGGFSHEYMFLDADKAAGESWSYIKDEGSSKTEYVILSTKAKHNILGIAYKDVIEVQVNYYLQDTSGVYDHWLTAIHYYAKGAGEIYHFYPSPISKMYGDINSFILK